MQLRWGPQEIPANAPWWLRLGAARQEENRKDRKDQKDRKDADDPWLHWSRASVQKCPESEGSAQVAQKVS